MPELEALGSPPPVRKIAFLERITEVRGPVASVQTIFLADDLMQREALMAEEIVAEEADMAVLKGTNADDSRDLPDYLVLEDAEGQENARLAIDGLWRRYFQHAHTVANSTGSAFLRGWIGFEVALRNGLVAARAQSLDLDATAYLVAPELAGANIDLATTISCWSGAADPLAALELLDKARWEWIEENGRWYSFHADELEAYAAKLVLMHRWRRIATEKTADTEPKSP